MLKKSFAAAAFIFLLFSARIFSQEFQGGQNEERLPAQEEESEKDKSFAGKSILSFDLGYLRTGLKNNGWGFGLSYERSFFEYLAAKGTFGHMTMYPKDVDTVVTTVGIKLEALAYPFGEGLDKFYAGFGIGTEFLMYDDVEKENSKDTVINIYPEIGWKQNFMDYVVVDFFFGYKILLNEPSALTYAADLFDSGIKYGARLKFNLGKICRLFFGKF